MDNNSNNRSPSPAPSSPSSNAESSVQVFVKNLSGETTALTVPPSTSIATITSLLINHPSFSTSTSSIIRPSSQDLRLTHAGRHLSPDSALSDHNLPPQSILALTSPLLGGAEQASSESNNTTATTSEASTPAASTPTAEIIPTPAKAATPKKKKFPRCAFKSCTSPIQRIVGDCGFCSQSFCGKHRLLESHACSGLEECREEEKRRNGERLGRERTVVVKGV